MNNVMLEAIKARNEERHAHALVCEADTSCMYEMDDSYADIVALLDEIQRLKQHRLDCTTCGDCQTGIMSS